MRWLIAIGLAFDMVGVGIIFLSSKKVEFLLRDHPLVEAFEIKKYWHLLKRAQKNANWGFYFVLIGFGCQFAEVIWPFIKPFFF